MQKKKTEIITARMIPADKKAITQRAKAACQRRCDFVVFRRTDNVEKWRVNVYSL